MAASQSLWMYFANASPVVKTVMLTLLFASVVSWAIIIERTIFLKKLKRAIHGFEDRFWSGVDLSRLYHELTNQRKIVEGVAYIFTEGFREFMRLCKQAAPDPDVVMTGVERSMRIAISRETDIVEGNLPWLATIGSISPYIGLFGTVWGIMTSFHALGSVQQATIAMVAPGISEALVATAMGLFAAIPAVIAYNRFANKVQRVLNEYDTFQEEFCNILHRQTHAIKSE